MASDNNNWHYADMSYAAYDPNAAQQFQNYDQFYANIPSQPATGQMTTNPGAGYYANYNDGTAMPGDDPTLGGDPYANEPPLMEELEINIDQIWQKTWAVLTFKNLNNHKNILHDPDLAGPLAFLLAFGFLLLLSGKIQFGYIYGLGILGCLIIYFVVHLMAPRNLSFMCTVSVLGYCLLPMVILSALSIFINLRATVIGNLIALVAILWCAIGASNLLVTAIDINNSRLVIAYPCALFYTVFALLTVF